MWEPSEKDLFPRAVLKRKKCYAPVGLTDVLIDAVCGMPDTNQFVTAKMVPDCSKLQPSSTVTLAECYPVGSDPDAALSALPEDDCRYFFCESGRSLFIWQPESAHIKTTVCILI